MIVVAVIVVLGATLGVSRLKPALQSVDAGTIWPDTVKRGSMLRQVRGLGSLVPIPDDVRLIPAETDVRVERIVGLTRHAGKGRYHYHGAFESASGAGSAEFGPGTAIGRG